MTKEGVGGWWWVGKSGYISKACMSVLSVCEPNKKRIYYGVLLTPPVAPELQCKLWVKLELVSQASHCRAFKHQTATGVLSEQAAVCLKNRTSDSMRGRKFCQEFEIGLNLGDFITFNRQNIKLGVVRLSVEMNIMPADYLSQHL